MATAEFSKFASILSAALSQHHLLGFEIQQMNEPILTLCDPMDCSLPGSSVHGILQARILEWGAIAFFLESIVANKASGGDGIPADLFQILKDDAVKVLHSICQQIWKTQQWP